MLGFVNQVGCSLSGHPGQTNLAGISCRCDRKPHSDGIPQLKESQLISSSSFWKSGLGDKRLVAIVSESGNAYFYVSQMCGSFRATAHLISSREREPRSGRGPTVGRPEETAAQSLTARRTKSWGNRPGKRRRPLRPRGTMPNHSRFCPRLPRGSGQLPHSSWNDLRSIEQTKRTTTQWAAHHTTRKHMPNHFGQQCLPNMAAFQNLSWKGTPDLFISELI